MQRRRTEIENMRLPEPPHRNHLICFSPIIFFHQRRRMSPWWFRFQWWFYLVLHPRFLPLFFRLKDGFERHIHDVALSLFSWPRCSCASRSVGERWRLFVWHWVLNVLTWSLLHIFVGSRLCIWKLGIQAQAISFSFIHPSINAYPLAYSCSFLIHIWCILIYFD